MSHYYEQHIITNKYYRLGPSLFQISNDTRFVRINLNAPSHTRLSTGSESGAALFLFTIFPADENLVMAFLRASVGGLLKMRRRVTAGSQTRLLRCSSGASPASPGRLASRWVCRFVAVAEWDSCFIQSQQTVRSLLNILLFIFPVITCCLSLFFTHQR